MKSKILLFLITLSSFGCVSKPTQDPVKETARKTGVSIYKTAEGETYRWIDKEVVGAVRDVLPSN